LLLSGQTAASLRRRWTQGTAYADATAAAGRPADKTLIDERRPARDREERRLRRWAPVAVGVISLGATAIPLWWHAPREAAGGGAAGQYAAAAVSQPEPAPAPAAEPKAAAAADPAPGGGSAPAAATTEAGEPAAEAPPTTTAAPEGALQDPPRERVPRAGNDGHRRGRAGAAPATSARGKGRIPVLRTRNGAPVVD
jgi:hypothetical protein